MGHDHVGVLLSGGRDVAEVRSAVAIVRADVFSGRIQKGQVVEDEVPPVSARGIFSCVRVSFLYLMNVICISLI